MATKVGQFICELVSEVLDVPLELVVDDADFVRNLGACLDVVELFMRCKEEFDIEIPDEATITTVGQLKKFVEAKLREKPLLSSRWKF